jgi:uncharacterized membrane protein YqjE
MDDRTDMRTMSQLLGDAFQQVSKLFQNELDLAKVELATKAKQLISSVALFAAGAVFVVPALIMALFALAAALIERGWSQPVSYLASAVLAAVIAAVLFALGTSRLDAHRLVPNETISQLAKDKQAAKRMAR